MARPRKNDPRPLIQPLVEQFAAELAAAVERATYDRVLALIDKNAPARTPRAGGKRSAVRCYYPGCKNIAAPRFGMFCAAEHKDLPQAEKDKYRQQRDAAG